MSHAVGVAAAAATAAVLGIASQELRTAKVAGSSMAPTFQTGSSILIERVSLFLGAVCHAALPLIEHRRRMGHLVMGSRATLAPPSPPPSPPPPLPPSPALPPLPPSPALAAATGRLARGDVVVLRSPEVERDEPSEAAKLCSLRTRP